VNQDLVHQLNEPEPEESAPLKPIETFMKQDGSDAKKDGDSEEEVEYDEFKGDSEDEFDVDADVAAAPKKKARVVKSSKRLVSWTPQVPPSLRTPPPPPTHPPPLTNVYLFC
jgi:hypothetical protein